jgi:DNA-binding Lrp family transcriptional regulator
MRAPHAVERRKRGVARVNPVRKVDDLDRRIIEELQANGRESFRRIAARLGPLRPRSRTTAELTIVVYRIDHPKRRMRRYSANNCDDRRDA